MLSSRIIFLKVLGTLLVLALVAGTPAGGVVIAAPSLTPAHDNIVISEFRTRGPAGDRDEFIEIFNPTNLTLDISGWELRVPRWTRASLISSSLFPEPVEPNWLPVNITWWRTIAWGIMLTG